MPTFSVTVTTTVLPAVSVQLSGNITYEQFRNSLGQFVYNVIKAYLYSSNEKQIQGVFKYMSYDSNGSQLFTNVVSAVDPYQTANSIYLDLRNRSIIINGQDAVNYNMQPNSQLSLKLYVDRVANQDGLDELHSNNFNQLGNSLNDSDFFDDYKDML